MTVRHRLALIVAVTSLIGAAYFAGIAHAQAALTIQKPQIISSEPQKRISPNQLDARYISDPATGGCWLILTGTIQEHPLALAPAPEKACRQ